MFVTSSRFSGRGLGMLRKEDEEQTNDNELAHNDREEELEYGYENHSRGTVVLSAASPKPLDSRFTTMDRIFTSKDKVVDGRGAEEYSHTWSKCSALRRRGNSGRRTEYKCVKCWRRQDVCDVKVGDEDEFIIEEEEYKDNHEEDVKEEDEDDKNEDGEDGE